MVDKNPNPKLRPTFRTKNRRVPIRPWMSEFLSKCFKNFKIGIWGSKNKAYMDEMVHAMLGRVKSRELLQPAFVWSQKECEELQWCNNQLVAWRCPLQAITHKYLQWNTTNTMIIDHKPLRVGCNPHRNVIVVKLFYSADLTKVGDDELYLKTSLWP
jgi:hypothetical protein